MKTIAIIPARGGSKGLKRKNVLEINGYPLIAYTIKSALQSKLIDKVFVSTDDKEIADISKVYGAEVPFIRPVHLSNDTAKSIDVLSHAVSYVENRYEAEVSNVVLLQPTSPLRNNKQIDEAIQKYLDLGRKPVVSVTEVQTHPNIIKRINEGRLVDFLDTPTEVTRRQDFEKLYQLNGAIYISTRDMIMKDNKIYDKEVYSYFMDKLTSVDIDDELDFLFADALMKKITGEYSDV
ncbi:acylneuraminate cytidylyltransferase family protein [Radiobacillus kanasensis]|uniref:acylneuraminate cytidylyltransferase family protein n=1 Tax=Radiobacillus kanasensis TaxID=2844358 RepID=UPI001E2DB7AC|nr:acylneuraminate cytidylyltransferase family protein [Radiobacillus kanasensis]UFT98888.1 acylneuraminate cytidylyltransferase family protein [Radiobacillus kanasensis]